jgi:hypothetical protein
MGCLSPKPCLSVAKKTQRVSFAAPLHYDDAAPPVYLARRLFASVCNFAKKLSVLGAYSRGRGSLASCVGGRFFLPLSRHLLLLAPLGATFVRGAFFHFPFLPCRLTPCGSVVLLLGRFTNFLCAGFLAPPASPLPVTRAALRSPAALALFPCLLH